MLKALYVGVGGFFGCIARYLFSIYSYKMLGASFPYGTFLVNIYYRNFLFDEIPIIAK